MTKTLIMLAIVFTATAWTGAAAQETTTIIDPLSGAPIVVPGLTVATDTPAYEIPSGLTRVDVGLAIGAHMADLATTMYVLGKDEGRCEIVDREAGRCKAQFYESNPVLARYAADPIMFSAVKWGLAAASIESILLIRDKHPTLAKWLLRIHAAVIGVVAVRNQQLLDATR